MTQLVYAVVLLVGFGAYWWFSQGRKGGRAVQEHLGLSAGEEIQAYVTGHHHLTRGAGDVGAAVLGMERTGKTVTFVVSTAGALVIRSEGSAPLRPHKGSLIVTKVADGVDRLSGTGGTAETADAFEISGPGLPTMTVALARSSAELVERWNRS